MTTALLAPVAALGIWSLVVLVWMGSVRVPEMTRAGLGPDAGRHTRELTMLSPRARGLADNYNHLMEQPTVFYAVAIAGAVAGLADLPTLALAWTYVGLRIVHTFVQGSAAPVATRFLVFAASSLVLLVLAVRVLVGVL